MIESFENAWLVRIAAATFEEFVRKKFVGAKSFSLEGSESLIPLLDLAIEKAGEQGIAEIVLGMAHRQVKAYEASEKALLRAKELDRGATPDIHWNLALLYGNNMLRYSKAADELELFLKATPNNPEAANIKKVIANFRSKKDGVK